MSKKRALVTGGHGFVGSNLVKRCLDEGWNVDIVDNMKNGREEFLTKGLGVRLSDVNTRYIDDFASYTVLHDIRNYGYDVVFHLAALPRVSYSVEQPVHTHTVNVDNSVHLIDACRNNVGRVVFASSSSVYGGADTLPTPETEKKDPKSPYALQKSIMEDYLKMYSDLYNLDTVSMRFFNVFGPCALGSSAYATAVASWLTSVMNNQPMRSDGDGEQSRDLCYVDNVVEACFLAATHDKPLKGEAFNVACGSSMTNNELLAMMKEKFVKAKVAHAPERAGDVKHTLADISKIKEQLGYVPLVEARDGVEKTVNWYLENWDWVKSMKLGI